ncbi:hypothetical protein HDV62DRAFT_14818 [Trichoderma sp. SZMC 28011]
MWWKSRLAERLRYQSVATPSDDEELADESLGELRALERTKRLHTRVFFAFASLCLFLSLSYYIERVSNHVSDERCTRRMSPPSPVLEAVRYEWTTFNQFFEPDIYSGYPSAASEAAWAKLWDFGAFSVPLDSLGSLNKSSMIGDFRLVGEDRGGGVGGLLEGAHQIHCLNLVRQFIYRNHWDYSKLPSFSGGDKTRRHHVDHCVSTLRMVLTCSSDVTPYVLETSPTGKIVGKGLPRKCRVYPDLVQWVNGHSVFSSVE